MKRFVEGVSREQSTLFPETLEDFIDEDNPVRIVDDFVEGLNLAGLGFDGWIRVGRADRLIILRYC